MHVQPEAAAIKIRNRPLWAPGAPEAIEQFIAARSGDVRVLEFGSGGSTMFLLRQGVSVTTIEHHELWADGLQQKAKSRGLADKLTILRRDRPYHDVPAEFAENTKFDILLVDGRERSDCLRKALPHVASDGLVLLDDSQRPRYWPAFTLLADRKSVTYECDARSTTIWFLESDKAEGAFVKKSFFFDGSPDQPKAEEKFLPDELLDGSALEPKYVKRAPIKNLSPVELDLQRIKLIERSATFVAPSVYQLKDSSLRIDAGRKLLNYRGSVFKEKTGDYVLSEDVAPFDGVIDLPGRTLDLTASGAGRYSFFLLDSLPKLEILRASGRSLGDFDTILVNSGAHWVGDILSSVIGEHKTKVRAFNKINASFRMEHSVHIDGIRSARFTPRWVHSYLERVFSGSRDQVAGTSEEQSFGPFVYISRQKADGRRIVNNDDFMALMQAFGFREIFAEDYSALQLARSLSEVRVLISPHGAGLANTIFCPKSATVVELFSSHFTPQYFYLARDIGQNYIAVPCVDAHGLNVFDRYDAATKDKAKFNREDVVVPLKELKDTLTRLCSSD